MVKRSRKRALLAGALLLLLAGAGLGSPLPAASAAEVFSLDGVLTRGEQLRLDITIKPLTAYSGEAYAVFQLMEGNMPLIINAVPVRPGEWEMTQFFNVAGPEYEVNVFVFDRFDSELVPPVLLAEPKVFQ